MASTLLSPGVAVNVSDQSQITSQPVQAGAAIVGPTVKGIVGIPKRVTTYSEYLANFGSTFSSGSDTYSFLTSISAYNYFQNGGTSLIVTRVQSGSWTSATSSFISSSLPPSSGSAFVLETLAQGAIMNNDSTETSGSLASGSANNVRWEIVSPNTSSGTFTVLVRRGDDNTGAKTILESFSNVSLDPTATNYISRIIGDQTLTLQGSGTSSPYIQTTGSFPNSSRYVRVKAVNLKTPYYLDNNGVAKAQYTSSIPVAASGSFGSATGTLFGANANFYSNINNTNTQGIDGNNVSGSYQDALNILASSEAYVYNVITAPGLVYSNASHASTLNTLISNTQNRGDAMAIVDLENYGSTVNNAVSDAAAINNPYTATYWPWVQITDPDAQQLAWIPASTLIPGVYAYNDNAAAAWFAPAGINRGGLSIVRQAERKLTTTDRDTLYVGKVNPIATFPGKGVIVYGQKTLQSKASALDRINVVRLLITLRSYISQIANNLVFEQNTTATRNQFINQVNPYLTSIQQRQGLYAFKVVMDSTNNTSDVIDRNQLIGAIYIQPTKTAEFIYLNFNITPTGVAFPQ